VLVSSVLWDPMKRCVALLVSGSKPPKRPSAMHALLVRSASEVKSQHAPRVTTAPD